MDNSRQKHNHFQRDTFETRVQSFTEPIAEDIAQRTGQIVAAAQLQVTDCVLDVGTGTGVLLPHIQSHIQSYGQSDGVQRIVACDLSPTMIAEARNRCAEARYWCGDVLNLPLEFGHFDAVFFNAMFGNVWDQRETLESIGQRLNPQARIIISHPMGAAFQAELHNEDARLVPHRLPDRHGLLALLSGLPLQMEQFLDQPQLYLCVLRYT